MKQAFATFVYGSYHKFLPYYIYCINKNYPEAKIIIFYQGKLPNRIASIIAVNESVVLHENIKLNDSWVLNYQHRGAVKQSLRHLLNQAYFEEYDEVYFGDVDILILKEKENLFEFHRIQAASNGLPFSNRVRPLKDGSPSKRLTGLHFIQPKSYYNKVQSIIDRINDDKIFRDQLFSNSDRNEEILYHINKIAFNFNPDVLMNNIRPWHGFHLGLVRGKTYLNKQTIKENSNLSFDQINLQLNQIAHEKKFLNYLSEIKCVELYDTLRFFRVNIPVLIKFEYEATRYKKNAIKRLKSLKARIVGVYK